MSAYVHTYFRVHIFPPLTHTRMHTRAHTHTHGDILNRRLYYMVWGVGFRFRALGSSGA